MPDDVAVDAPLLIPIVITTPVDLCRNIGRDDGQGDQLRMRMFHRRPGRRPMILKDQDVPEADILAKIQDAVAVSPEHILQFLFGKGRQGRLVLRRFDDDFMRAHAVHAIVQAKAFPSQLALDLKCRKLVRHHANMPPRRVGRFVIGPVGEDFRGSLSLIARTQRAQRHRGKGRCHRAKVSRSTRAVRRDDDPASDDRIAS